MWCEGWTGYGMTKTVKMECWERSFKSNVMYPEWQVSKYYGIMAAKVFTVVVKAMHVICLYSALLLVSHVFLVGF